MLTLVTNHAKKRMKERLGIKKKLIQKLSDLAYEYGITHKDLTGSINKYIDSLYFKNKAINNFRIYKEKVFLFHDNKLITIINLPAKYKIYVNKIILDKNKII